MTLATSAIALSGCGSDSSDSKTTESNAVGRLLQVDGTIPATGASDQAFVLDPSADGDNIEFGYGPDVSVGTIRALAANQVVARVYYSPTSDAPVATSVKQAPEYDKDVKTYTGSIASVDADEIVLDGEDGERAFAIADAEPDAFDIPHLKDHKEEGTSVKVYFLPGKGDELSGLGYEDA